jgi:DNA primase
MDVIALAQSGIDYAVATLGTAITPAHIDRLFKTTDRVVFCFDGDQAGRQAAWKALEVSIGVIQENRRIDFLFLPDGEDPDTLVREKGKEAFTALVENATPLSSWFFESLSHALNLSSLDGLSALVEQCKPYLNRMPDTSLRTALVAELTRLTRFRLGNESDISRLVFTSHSQPAEMEKTSRDRFKKSAQIRQRTPLRVGLALLLDNPELAHTLERPERYLVVPLPGIDLFVAVVQFIQSHDRINAAQILHHFSEDTHAAALKKLACWDHLVPEEGVQNEFKGIVQYLEQQVSQQRLHILEKKMRDGTLSAEEAQEWQQLIRHGRETR